MFARVERRGGKPGVGVELLHVGNTVVVRVAEGAVSAGPIRWVQPVGHFPTVLHTIAVRIQVVQDGAPATVGEPGFVAIAEAIAVSVFGREDNKIALVGVRLLELEDRLAGTVTLDAAVNAPPLPPLRRKGIDKVKVVLRIRKCT